MSEAATRAAIIVTIADEATIAPERLHETATLAELEIESIDMVSILFAIEDRFGIDIAPEELAGAETLGDLIDRVMAKAPAA